MATVNENVQYTLSLKDLLTGKLGEANAAAKSLESTMGAVKGALGFLGVGFAVFKGGEFVKESLEKFHQLEQATAQVRAGLTSTQGAAGMTFKDVEESAKNLASQMKYSRAELLSMQSILLTFPSITKDSFGDASEIIADMSTRLGQDLKSSAIQVGKALQDPIKGVTALRRVGVNFNEQQTQMIKNMVLSGHKAQAQAAIMKELRTEFEGSARAAAEADPLFAFNKAMGSFSRNIGEAANTILESLTPVLEVVGEKFVELGTEISDFFKNFKNESGQASIGLQLVWAAIGGVTIAFKAMFGIAETALRAIAVVINAIAWGIDKIRGRADLASNDLALMNEHISKIKENVSSAPTFGAMVNQWMGDLYKKEEFKSLKDQIKKAKDEFQDGGESIEEYKKKIEGLREKVGEAAVGNKIKMPEHDTLMKMLGDASKIKGKFGVTTTEEQVADISAKGAKGQKSVTINVSIGKLIETFKVSTTTMKEGANQVEEMVANAMLRAINEFQVHASV